jgi:ribosomal protein S18 acetylase RimI-like enzyme
VYGRPEPLDPVIDQARAFVRGRAPWSLFLEQSVWESRRSRLESLGFRLERSEPLMMRDTSPVPELPPPPGLTLLEATRPEDLACFFVAMGRGSGIAPGFLYRFLRPGSLLASLHVGSQRYHVGLLEGRVVATSTSTVQGEEALITSVATLPRFRRRGFGAALTWAAVRSARERGARRVFLLASPMGEPVYRKMGFEIVDRTHIVAAPDRPPLLMWRVVPWAIAVLAWFALVGHRWNRWPIDEGESAFRDRPP